MRARLFRLFPFIIVALWAAVAFAAPVAPPERGPLDPIYERIAIGLIAFFVVDVWRNQRTLFKKNEDLHAEVSEIKGFCKGKNEGAGC